MGPAELAKRNRVAVVAYYLQKDLRARLAQRRGTYAIRVHTSGTRLSTEAGQAHAEHNFAALLRLGGITTDDFVGKDVLELGPGDNLGIARLALEHGAREVVAVDRFAVGDIASTAPGVTFTEGVSVEDAADHFGENQFDLIYSVAVLEHVADLDAAFDSMARMLRPGGLLLHFIGGGDHGMFTDGGHHPLTYLQIPRTLYLLMTAHSGGPNRVFPTTIRRLVEHHDWDWKITPTFVLGDPGPLEERPLEPREWPRLRALVEDIRPRLREPFRSLPVSDLITEGTFLRARARETLLDHQA